MNGIGVVSGLAVEVRDMMGTSLESSSIEWNNVVASSFVPMTTCTFLLFARSMCSCMKKMEKMKNKIIS